jgi:hypothetical protein
VVCINVEGTFDLDIDEDNVFRAIAGDIQIVYSAVTGKHRILGIEISILRGENTQRNQADDHNKHEQR